MNNITRILMQGAAGAGGDPTYVDDVFSTYLYKGTGAARTITNGIDLAGEGGLVWVKGRSVGYYNNLQDNVSGLTGTAKYLTSNENHVANSAGSPPYLVTAFNNNGFDLGIGGQVNINNYTFASWTFRRQKGFFDIVSWTGNGSNRTIAHNLGSVPGCIMIKRTDTQATWIVYHKGLGYYTTDPSDYAMQGLNNLAAKVNYNWLFQSAATATGFEIGTGDYVNANGGSYVAYIFADDDQKFGEGGDQSIIKCGYYQGTGSPNLNVNLGFEPQWLLIKNADRANTNWMVFDSMRGIPSGMNDALLHPNSAAAESSPADFIDLTATGFKVQSTGNDDTNVHNEIFLYIAIRRPDGLVGKPAEVGTDAFAMDMGNGSSTIPAFDSGFPVDFGLTKNPTSGGDWYTVARLLGGNHLVNSGTNTISNSNWTKWDSNVGEGISWSSAYQSWMWKRGAGFDVVTYDGNSTPGRTVQHNLGRIPEMIWIKCRNTAESWVVGHKGLNGGTNPWEYSVRLNDNHTQTDYPYFNDTAPTSTLFTLNNNGQVNGTGTNDYIAMLFASVEGISKCGYYNGSNSGQTITTGFQPRFLIIKNATLDTSWQVLDTTRGWASGNDKRLFMDTNNAQSTGDDVGQPTSTGFTLTGGDGRWNNTGHTFIYYAHA